MAAYKVVLTGVMEGLEAAEVAPRLAALCKIPVEGATALLASPNMVIKGALDPRMAAEYKDALQRVGCKARIEKESGESGLAASRPSRSTAGGGRAALDARQMLRHVNALVRQVKRVVVALAGLARREAARADAQLKSADAGPRRSQSFFAAIAGFRGAGAAPKAKRSVLAISLIAASAAVATVAIAGFFVIGGSSSGGPCPGEYDPARWTNCVGEVRFPNGEKYVGDMKDGQPHGQGMLLWPNGERYVGGWRDGRRNGRGTFTWPDGTKYVGEFRNDKKHGHGTQTFPNGRIYVGEYKDGNPIKETMQR